MIYTLEIQSEHGYGGLCGVCIASEDLWNKFIVISVRQQVNSASCVGYTMPFMKLPKNWPTNASKSAPADIHCRCTWCASAKLMHGAVLGTTKKLGGHWPPLAETFQRLLLLV